MREVAQTGKGKPLSDLDIVFHVGRYLRPNHLRKFC